MFKKKKKKKERLNNFQLKVYVENHIPKLHLLLVEEQGSWVLCLASSLMTRSSPMPAGNIENKIL